MNQLEFNQQLCDFLGRAPTPFHAVALMTCELEAAGFVPLPGGAITDLAPGGKYYLTRNDSALVAFIIGTDSGPAQGMRMIGAHTDSPCLMVKPCPEKLRHGYFQLGVEVYGGALLNPWFDRDLSLAGRISYECGDGQLRSGEVVAPAVRQADHAGHHRVGDVDFGVDRGLR